MQHPATDDGFSLLEVLVAFVIFAAVTVALQQAHISGLRGIRAAHDGQAALEVARSLLARAGTVTPLTPGLDDWGDEGPYRWHMVARKYVAPEQAPALPPQLEAFWTTVTVMKVTAGALGPSVSLDTLKLQVAAP